MGLELDELLVLRRVHGLVVVPGGEVPDERRGVHAAQLVLGHAESHDGRVLAAEALVRELLVEGHVGVAVDRGQDGGVAAGGEALDLPDDGLVILVIEGRVLLGDGVGGDALGERKARRILFAVRGKT
jgi:hypothetical protein